MTHPIVTLASTQPLNATATGEQVIRVAEPASGVTSTLSIDVILLGSLQKPQLQATNETPITVDYKLEGATATVGVDWAGTAYGTLTWGTNDLSPKQISFTATGDDMYEKTSAGMDEYLMLTFENATNVNLVRSFIKVLLVESTTIVPSAPTNVVRLPLTTPEGFTITWEPPVQNGGGPIVAYHVNYRVQNANYADELGHTVPGTARSLVIGPGGVTPLRALATGFRIDTIRIRASNSCPGWSNGLSPSGTCGAGAFTTVGKFEMPGVSSPPLAFAVTNREVRSTVIPVSWLAVNSNNGLVITSYTVCYTIAAVQKCVSTGNTNNYFTIGDGSGSPSSTALSASTQVLNIYVRAENAAGLSEPSNQSPLVTTLATTAVTTVPHDVQLQTGTFVVPAVTQPVTQPSASTSPTTLHVKWTKPASAPSSGVEAVLKYEIWYTVLYSSAYYADVSFVVDAGLVTDFVIGGSPPQSPGLPSGTSVSVRVRALNGIGWSRTSTTQTYTTAEAEISVKILLTEVNFQAEVNKAAGLTGFLDTFCKELGYSIKTYQSKLACNAAKQVGGGTEVTLIMGFPTVVGSADPLPSVAYAELLDQTNRAERGELVPLQQSQFMPPDSVPIATRLCPTGVYQNVCDVAPAAESDNDTVMFVLVAVAILVAIGCLFAVVMYHMSWRRRDASGAVAKNEHDVLDPLDELTLKPLKMVEGPPAGVQMNQVQPQLMYQRPAQLELMSGVHVVGAASTVSLSHSGEEIDYNATGVSNTYMSQSGVVVATPSSTWGTQRAAGTGLPRGDVNVYRSVGGHSMPVPSASRSMNGTDGDWVNTPSSSQHIASPAAMSSTSAVVTMGSMVNSGGVELETE
jgi:hypothetical protein